MYWSLPVVVLLVLEWINDIKSVIQNDGEGLLRDLTRSIASYSSNLYIIGRISK